MSTPSPDARAVVAAVDRLTTQLSAEIRRASESQLRCLVDIRQTPDDDATTTCDASTLGIANRHLGPCVLRDGHDGPVHLGPEGETWATVTAEAHTLADGTEAGFRAALAADDEEQQRRARRDSLHNLLARLERTQLHGDEIDLLRRHAEAEMRDTDTARAVATGNLRHVRMLYADLQTAQAERDAARAELEQAQAALARVRAAAHWARQNFPGMVRVHARLTDALDATEQPTTKDTPEPLRVTPCDPPRMAVHCCGQCIAIAPSDPDLDRLDRIALVGDTITVVIGTPGGPPPSTGKGAHLIAEVEVPRGTTAITAAHITSAGLIFYRPDA